MIQIISDSMSDFFQQDAQKHNVAILPLSVSFNQETFYDGITITCEEFYKKMATASQLPKTSQVAPESFYGAIKPLLAQGDEVLIITGSSLLSGTYQSALIAKEMFEDKANIHVFDSMTASLGESFLIYEALKMRDAGAGVVEILATLERLRGKQRLFGSVDDLKYLVMGGRLSSLGGKAGSILKIKPMLEVGGGTISLKSVVRGKKKMMEWFLNQLKKLPPDPNYPVFFAAADAQEALMELKSFLEEKGMAFPKCTVMSIGPIIGTHVGPGTVAMSWVTA